MEKKLTPVIVQDIFELCIVKIYMEFLIWTQNDFVFYIYL